MIDNIECSVCSLVNLAIIVIRQNTRQDESSNLDKLGLPSVLVAAVKCEALADEISDKWSDFENSKEYYNFKRT